MVFTLIALALAMASLEFVHPRYFSDDDNRDMSLPPLVFNYQSLQHGELAEYSFHTFAGAPHLANGQSLVLYLPAYAAAWTSGKILDDVYLSVEALTIFHLLLSGAGVFLFVRLLTGDSSAASLAALAFPLSSFCLFVGRQWLCVTACAAWFPWMLYFASRSWRANTPSWLIGLSLSRLLLLYFGYTQYFIWAVILECFVWGLAGWLTAGVYVRSLRVVRVASAYVLSWIAAAFLGLPLLWPQYQQTAGSYAKSAALSVRDFKVYSMPARAFLHGLFLPLSTNPTVTSVDLWPSVFYVAHVAVPVSLLAFVTLIPACLKWGKQARILAGFWGLTILAHALSANWFWVVLYHLPMFNRFRWPFKIQLFTSFFLVCAGAAAQHFWSGRLRGSIRSWLIAFVLVATLMDFAVVDALHRPRGWIDQVPLTAEDPLAAAVKPGRVFSLGYRVSEQWPPWTNRSRSMGYAYAQLWGYDDLGGYDTLALATSARVSVGAIHTASWEGPPERLPLDHFRNWGVQWYIVNAHAPAYADTLARQGVETVSVEPDRIVMQDPHARPFVWWEDGNPTSIAVDRLVNYADFRYMRSEAGTLIVNLVALSDLRAEVDGRPMPCGHDAEGHVRVFLPAGQHTLRLAYRNEAFHNGLRLAGVGLFPLLAGVWLLRGPNARPEVACEASANAGSSSE
ncbi:MAG: hypothetical protein ABSH47_26450 [Bryobacteraceae bacterium]